MSIVCILLAAVSAALSLFYSGAATIVQSGGVKEFGALPPEILCAVGAAIFALIGALLLHKKKKFAAIPLFVAAAVQAYANLRVESPYPYLLASVALYAFAGLGSLLIRLKAGIEEEIFDPDEKAAEPEAEGGSAAEDLNSEGAAPMTENSENEIETEIFDDENGTTDPLPDKSGQEPKKKWRLSCPCRCGKPCLLLGILLALAGAGISLHFSDVWQQTFSGGVKLIGLKEFLALDPLGSRVIGAAAIALLAALFHLGRKTFSAILFFAAAGILASLQYGLEIEYPHWQAGIFLYLLAAFRAEYVGIDAMKNVPPRRYTWAYVYGFILAIAASFIALHQSGICLKICASGGLCSFADAFVKMDGGLQTVVLISALGIFGGAMSLFMLPSASWVLLGAMLLGLLTQIIGAAPYAYSWLVVLLLAIAGLCSASSVRADAPLPVKRLTIAGAFFLMILAGCAGSALTLYVTKGDSEGSVPAIEAELPPEELDAEEPTPEEISAPEDEPEVDEEISDSEEGPQPVGNDERVAELEKQLLMLMAENDAKIADLENQLEALAADGDDQVKNLTEQLAAKDGEIEKLTAAVTENEAKISELEKQIQDLTSNGDDQVKSLTEQLAAKDGEIEKLTAAASENEAKISELEKQAQDLTSNDDDQVKSLTEQLAAKDGEIEKLTSAVTENEAKISELEKQIRDLTSDRDEQVKNLTEGAAVKDEEIKKLAAAATEKDEKISELQYLLEAHKARAGAATVRYICVRGRANVRNVPHANAGSKIISVMRDEIKEVLEVTHPEGSSGVWYRVEYSSGTGWVFGGDAVFPFEVQK